MTKSMIKFLVGTAAIMLLVACTLSPESEVAGFTLHVNQVALDNKASKSAVVAFSHTVETDELSVDIVKVDSPASVVFKAKVSDAGKFTEWQKANQGQFYLLADFSGFAKSGVFQVKASYRGSSVLSHPFTVAENAIFNKTTPALLDYFRNSRNDERYNWEQDKRIRVFDEQRYVDVRGGWNDAGGDTGKYLSHLSYSNFLNPQQLSLVGWALAYSYQSIPEHYRALNLEDAIVDEIFWGADYLHRILDPAGYFYMTVFDQWHTNNAERVVTSYEGPDGIYTEKYQAAFRQGAGAAIAALVRASEVANITGKQGQYSGAQYLTDAERAFNHLVEHNASYCDDGIENIIDDYTALLAATELYRVTEKPAYLEHARMRASNLANRLTDDGWFISNQLDAKNKRPYYHAAEAGFPVYALSHYVNVEKDSKKAAKAKHTIAKHLAYQIRINQHVANPFDYPRQPFKTFKNDSLDSSFQTGFFIPHANETGYWWQGENARLASLSAAATLANNVVKADSQSDTEVLRYLPAFAQHQLDWILGRNPYDMTMLNGFGTNNPVPYEGLGMVLGGISNGITGAKDSDQGRGIEYGPEPDWHNWRWVEQWLPHSTWFLLANTELVKASQGK